MDGSLVLTSINLICHINRMMYKTIITLIDAEKVLDKTQLPFMIIYKIIIHKHINIYKIYKTKIYSIK